MATPRAIRRRPNMQGSRGGPARGGMVARPKPKPAGQGQGYTDAVSQGPMAQAFTRDSGTGGGATPDQLQAAVQKLSQNPTFKAQVLAGGDPQQAAQSAAGAGGMQGMPSAPRPGAEPALDGGMVSAQPQRPAWQELQEAGIGGQGSAAANKAKLAELQLGGGGPGGSGGIIAPDQVPGGAPPMPQGGAPTLQGPPMLKTGGGLFGSTGPAMAGALKQQLGAAQAQPRPFPTQNVPPEQPLAGPAGGAAGGGGRPMPPPRAMPTNRPLR